MLKEVIHWIAPAPLRAFEGSEARSGVGGLCRLMYRMRHGQAYRSGGSSDSAMGVSIMLSKPISVSLPFLPLLDKSTGIPVLVLASMGMKDEITLTLVQPKHEQPGIRECLTVTEAARQHLGDVDGLTLTAARARVTRAANAGEFADNGKSGVHRRIEPQSFAAWRLKQRERALDEVDDLE